MSRRPSAPSCSPPGALACGIARMVHAVPEAALPGLTIAETGFALDPAWWGCCPGDGQRFHAASNTITRCDLARRTRAAASVASQWLAALDGDARELAALARAVPPALLARHGVRLMQTSLNRAHKGLAEPLLDGRTAARSPLWLVAISAAWRYGLAPHVVDVSKGGLGVDAALLPNLAKPSAEGVKAPRTVIFALGAAQLWNQDVAERLELVIDIAYRSRLPLWCELAPAQNAARAQAAAPMLTREAYSVRVKRLRASQQSRLTRGASPRLVSVCELSALAAP